MSRQRISAVIICVACAGIWVDGVFFEGARFLWWEPVIWLEAITYAFFKSIECRR